MSAVPLSPRTNAIDQARLRRWLVTLSMVLVLLAGYGLALGWMAERLGADVEKSVRMDPALPEVADSATR